MLSRLLRVLAIAAALGSATPASAEESDPRTESRVFFTSGVQALDDGRPADALLLFQRAYDTFPHFATLYNIALCQRALGHPAAAANALRKYLDDGGDAIADKQRTSATALLADLESKVAVVTMKAPPHAKMSLDGKPVSGPAVRVEPGQHELRANVDESHALRRAISVRAGEHVVVDFLADLPAPVPPAPAPAASRPAAPAAAERPPPQEPNAPSRFNAAFWTAVGVSAATLAVGAYCGAVALSDSNAYHNPNVSDAEAQRDKSRGQVLRVVADSAFGVSAASAVVAVIIATRSMVPPPRTSTVRLAPAFGSRFAGIELAIVR
jgi:hypothetical protein